MSKEAIAIKALEALARLGNGDQYGNSTVNVIARTALFEIAEQPEQEPVGINGLTEAETNATASVMGLVNTTPQRTWVGLTDEERLEAAEIDGADEWFWKVCKAIETKLKQKNGFAEEKNT